MAAFQKLGDYTNGTANDGTEVTNEFNNIYNAFNGTSSDKEMERKLDHGTEPPMVFNQIGAGPIIEGKQNSNLKFTFDNAGKLVNDNIVKEKYSWFIPLPTDLGSGVDFGDLNKVFLFPAGTGMRITKLSIIRTAGNHTAGLNLTARLSRNGVNIGSGIGFNDTNSGINTEYSEALNVSPSNGDRINLALTGTDIAADVTVLMEWEQKLG